MKISQEFKKQLVTYLLGGFGLVAGLAWNDAITSFIEFLYPLQKDGLPAKFIYAIVITVVVAVVSWILTRPPSAEKS